MTTGRTHHRMDRQSLLSGVGSITYLNFFGEAYGLTIARYLGFNFPL